MSDRNNSDYSQKKFILEDTGEIIAKEYNCIYCHEQGNNKVAIACVGCLFQGNIPTNEEAAGIKQVWEGGVIVRKEPQSVVNFLKILKQMVEAGDIITGSRVCKKHDQLELILGDKEKEFCVEWALGSLVKYETNENILKEIERRKEKGLWVDWYKKDK